MTDFLSSLVERSFGTAAAVRPRVALLFEPAFPHGEPPADTSSLREVDSVSGAQERDLVRPAAERHDERAQDSRPTRRSETDGHAARVQDTLLPAHAEITAAVLQPRPERHVMQAAVGEETDRPRGVQPRDIRQDEVAPVLPRDLVLTASRSVDSVRPAPPEIVARSKESGRNEDRGLLVPSKLGARIAADLQSSVSATNAASRNRPADPRRAVENRDANAERDVHVTIGRIEVRATGGEKTPVRDRHVSPVMGLDEYLRRQARRGGQ